MKAFSLFELIFVILIIGILGSVALPRLFTSVDEALYSKVKTQIATIRAGIVSLYSKNIISGINKCPNIEKNYTDNYLFENILSEPIRVNSGDVKWELESFDSNQNRYSIKIGKEKYTLIYEKNISKNCTFKCINSLCDRLE